MVVKSLITNLLESYAAQVFFSLWSRKNILDKACNMPRACMLCYALVINILNKCILIPFTFLCSSFKSFNLLHTF